MLFVFNHTAPFYILLSAKGSLLSWIRLSAPSGFLYQCVISVRKGTAAPLKIQHPFE